MPPRPIWIDCDPGQDDAVMLLLALASPDELDVRGVSAVAGNVPLALGQRNARAVVALAGRADVPVFAGRDRPLAGPPRPHDSRRGETGLEGWPVPAPALALRPEPGVDALIAAARATAPPGLTLVATGPLTNVAAALTQAPDIAANLRAILIMGGVWHAGPRAPAVEFNFACDPEAARIVLGCGTTLALFGLDVTLQAAATPQRLARIAAIDTDAARAAHAMLALTDADGRARYGTDGAPLHDPCPVARLLRPALFDGRPARVSVDDAGRVRVDHRHDATDIWLDRIDADGYFELIADRLEALP